MKEKGKQSAAQEREWGGGGTREDSGPGEGRFCICLQGSLREGNAVAPSPGKVIWSACPVISLSLVVSGFFKLIGHLLVIVLGLGPFGDT